MILYILHTVCSRFEHLERLGYGVFEMNGP